MPVRYSCAVSFDVAAEAYDRFMGRYSALLSEPFADFAGVVAGQRVLDVGCGPGALTGELVARLGADAVAAADPSEPFVEAARARHPGVDVRLAPAERLPFDDRYFDVVLAQLVVHFMSDPVAGVREMRRVAATDGMVAACVWDFAGERGPISTFWAAARSLDPTVEDELHLAGVRDGHLAELFRAAGLHSVEQTAISVNLDHPSFELWWDPFVQGVGPAGTYAKGLGPERLGGLRETCRARLPAGPFTTTAWAWAVRGRA